MAAQKHLAGEPVAQRPHRARQAGAILDSHRREGRPVRTSLAERQIAAKHGNARSREGVRHGDQQRRVAIRSRAVRQNQTVPISSIGRMQKSAFKGCNGMHTIQASKR